MVSIGNVKLIVNHISSCADTERVGLSHLQLAQSMREEAKKLEEFREKQREVRKRVSDQPAHRCTDETC